MTKSKVDSKVTKKVNTKKVVGRSRSIVVVSVVLW